MPLLRSEPPAPVRSLGELFALAEALEVEAASRYADLAGQMRAAGLASVADVFQHLAAEERGHAAQVIEWSRAELGVAPDVALIRWQPPETFDEEEARTIASSRLASAYRALSMAVRNEERAFLFWTYVAAQTDQDRLREAAEQMAREELDHIARLRRERRQAFHLARAAAGDGQDWTLAALENRLAALLDETAHDARAGERARMLSQLAAAARLRAEALTHAPLGETRLLRHVRPEVSARLRSAAELLLDCYLDLGERLPSQAGRDQAQIYATQLLDCAAAVREAAGEPA